MLNKRLKLRNYINRQLLLWSKNMSEESIQCVYDVISAIFIFRV